jgi:hypothetical protein
MVKIQGPNHTPAPLTPGRTANTVAENKTPAKTVTTDAFAGRVPEDDLRLYGRNKPDTEAIARLQDESEKAYQGLRQLVEQLLARQGIGVKEVERGAALKVDAAARAEAVALVADDGELGPEAVSTRIVDFARSLSGGDSAKIGILRGAIEEGFREAARMLGGTLPEVSLRTYDMVMQKLDAWAAE